MSSVQSRGVVREPSFLAGGGLEQIIAKSFSTRGPASAGENVYDAEFVGGLGALTVRTNTMSGLAAEKYPEGKKEPVWLLLLVGAVLVIFISAIAWIIPA